MEAEIEDAMLEAGKARQADDLETWRLWVSKATLLRTKRIQFMEERLTYLRGMPPVILGPCLLEAVIQLMTCRLRLESSCVTIHANWRACLHYKEIYKLVSSFQNTFHIFQARQQVRSRQSQHCRAFGTNLPLLKSCTHLIQRVSWIWAAMLTSHKKEVMSKAGFWCGGVMRISIR